MKGYTSAVSLYLVFFWINMLKIKTPPIITIVPYCCQNVFSSMVSILLPE